MAEILVLAPHADDEVLGCGGMIARRAAEGDRIHVAVFGIGGLKHRHMEHAAQIDHRLEEFRQATQILGVIETDLPPSNVSG